MAKPISTRVHGILDYMTAGFLVTLPRVMGWDKKVTRLLDMAAAGATGYSLLTRYELGVARVLPMKAHLTLDALSGCALLGAAAMMDDEDDDVRATVAAIGAWEIGAALLTRTRTSREAKARSTAPVKGFPAEKTGGHKTSQQVPVGPGL
jgi:hypothetical protein